MKLEKLIKENVEFLNDYLPKIQNAIDELVDLFAKNQENNALDILPRIIEGLSWCVNSMSSLERVGVVENIEISNLNNFLYQIQKAMEIADYVLVSDLFEYEISPIIKVWSQKVKKG